jgi:rhodanese-related sulfurtransferase
MIDEGYEYDAARLSYKLVANPELAKAIGKLVAEKGGGPGTTLILLSSTGERSAKAASHLAAIGYASVLSVSDGVHGEAPTRTGTAQGWKRSGLPWAFTLTREQLYQSPSK